MDRSNRPFSSLAKFNEEREKIRACWIFGDEYGDLDTAFRNDKDTLGELKGKSEKAKFLASQKPCVGYSSIGRAIVRVKKKKNKDKEGAKKKRSSLISSLSRQDEILARRRKEETKIWL